MARSLDALLVASRQARVDARSLLTTVDLRWGDDSTAWALIQPLASAARGRVRDLETAPSGATRDELPHLRRVLEVALDLYEDLRRKALVSYRAR